MSDYYPELDYYFNQYWTTEGEITVDHVSLPEVAISGGHADNMFEVLFTSNYSGSATPNYFLKNFPKSMLPKSTRERIDSTLPSIDCWISADNTDPDAGNIFFFDADTINLLNLLADYRLGSIPDLSTIDYNLLSQNMGKLIYIYLDLVVNFNFALLNDTGQIANPDDEVTGLLEVLFEIYVVNEAHKVMRSWTFLIDSGVVSLRPWRERHQAGDVILTTNTIHLKYAPYSAGSLVIHIEGKMWDNTLFTLDVSDPGNPFITWDSNDVQVYEHDIFVIDYYVDSENATYPIDPDQQLIYVPFVEGELTVDQVPNLQEDISANQDVIDNLAASHPELHDLPSHTDTDTEGETLDENISGNIVVTHKHIPDDIEGGGL